MRSFRNRTVQKPIRGTRTSPHTAQVITSSGNPSLDTILGGGLPIGSIFLCEEDRFVTHAKVLAKYFLAEGVLSKQKIFLGSLDDLPAEMLRRLPRPLTDVEIEVEQLQEEVQSEPLDKNGLRIAWRYNDLPLVNSEQAPTKIGHHFNLMEHMDPKKLYYANTTVWDGYKTIGVQEDLSSSSTSVNEAPKEMQEIWDGFIQTVDALADGENNNEQSEGTASNTNTTNTTTTTTTTDTQSSVIDPNMFHNPRYGRLLQDIQQLLRDKSFNPGAKKNLCRVCLTSLGSPLWYDDNFGEDLLKFLTILMASVRSCNSVCFITMPMHLVAKYDTNLVPKIRQLVDYSVELESFAGSDRETHPAFKEYSGLLHLHKMTALNTLAVHMPETTDLAFKLRRKKFVIEKFHLPPELQESASHDILATAKCGGGGNVLPINSNQASASLDF
ncbi:elongator complex protein 4 [Drosophila tropicalis]|uniref:elongator complex protein 4 n=1 Tax=Drosophila tropicalis TaxID=46794 RepID=UPI0035AB9548